MPEVTGQLTETGGGPLSGWKVELRRFQQSAGAGWLPHGSTTTNASGNFVITAPALGILFFGGAIICRVRALSPVGRVVWESADFTLDPLSDTRALGTVAIPSGNLRGWLVTDLGSAGTPTRLTTNNIVSPLIDNVAAWAALQAAVAGAMQEIDLGMFYFDIQQVFLTFVPDPPATGTPTTGTRLETELLTANRSRAVTVRLLIRDAALVRYPADTADRVISYFAAATPAHTIEVRRYTTDGRLPMHAKYVICDGTEVHVLGSPLLQEYFDGVEHRVCERRRGSLDPPGLSSKHAVRVPIHDVGVRVRGGAVRDVQEAFFLHWNNAGAPSSSTLTPTTPPAPHAAVQVTRSLPGNTFPGLPNGETSALESYLRCFENATDYVYLENQYLTEFTIYEAIRLALRNNSTVQFILLINSKVDIPPYWRWQRKRLADLTRALRGDGTVDRFGVFTAWGHDESVTPHRLIRHYIHSKVGIADDVWATIGSANLDGVSLMTGEHLAPMVSVPGMEHRRATELNAVIYSGVAGMPESAVPGDLRKALWAEHLGYPAPTDPALATRPAGGWLRLWRDRANEKKLGLAATPTMRHSARVLEWTGETDVAAYLRALDVNPRNFHLLDEFPSFDFATGGWRSPAPLGGACA